MADRALMVVPFPDLKPTARELVAPQWAQTSARSQAGFTSRRKWGSSSFGPQLTLSFACSDPQADSIFAAYEASKGGIDRLSLPETIWQGMTGTLLNRVQGYGSRLSWVFPIDSPPMLKSLVCGRSEVSIRLVAELRA
jgi:hypothetical protein